MADTGTTPRERYRTQVRAEIKQRAWEQIAAAGASALSLNAIAKQMGMSGPALYRYFAGRDELITELIRDAYRSLADTFRATAAPQSPADGSGAPGAHLAALAHTLRDWALDDPQRYFLIYGTPVPGYHAPDDITTIASEIMATLLEACATLPSDGPAPFRRAMAFWTRLHGVLSLELAGHFTGMDLDPAQLYAGEVDALLRP
ncbi:TetR/AcrR family transcriptional regulator [Streptomyces heilongjiangensis]|uniref:TetR/AcrR family transcriptional regulator n=1 Tax=Streptomyces heilongjiangensis TaxID=945052 RepID=A0ABW1B5W4_9ACTN|nr:TetR/AcrR family transcriptional regulator [Streptomyces heilongjiangensis]MDC2949285.1 TetR/AcrR family transcriptional regulator [Streptomyces heilongjiangensis]